MESELTLQQKLDLANVTYNNGLGKLIKLDEYIYGIIYSNKKIKLINVKNDIKVINEEYSLIDINEYTIVITNHSLQKRFTKSLILNKETFEIIFETDKKLFRTGKIVYEDEAYLTLVTSYADLKIFNLAGKQIGTVNSGFEFDLSKTDNDNYYIASHRLVQNNRDCSILKCNDDYSKIEEVWYSTEYDVELIGTGLLLFSRYDDYSNSYVYDIINNKVL